MKSPLKEAIETVAQRQKTYGSPGTNMNRVAEMWSTLLGTEVSPVQVALCMVALKLAREVENHNWDNLVDIAGYTEVAARCLED